MALEFLIQLLVNGFIIGLLYGVVAMSFVLIYKSSLVVNFAQGEFLLIGAWPCLMGVSMYLQQKLNPAPPDPIQAKIFMFFPLFLTVILAPFPSGLVIYWTINNILTMAQQVVIMKRTSVKTIQK